MDTYAFRCEKHRRAEVSQWHLSVIDEAETGQPLGAHDTHEDRLQHTGVGHLIRCFVAVKLWACCSGINTPPKGLCWCKVEERQRVLFVVVEAIQSILSSAMTGRVDMRGGVEIVQAPKSKSFGQVEIKPEQRCVYTTHKTTQIIPERECRQTKASGPSP